MRKLLAVVAVVVALMLATRHPRAQEIVSLAIPAVQTTSSYRVQVITLDLDGSTIYVQLRGTNNELIQKTYGPTTTPTGATLLHQLNIGNFSVNSLMKAVYNRLLTDGVIPAGSVVGTAQ
jgi:hypothetical protein